MSKKGVALILGARSDIARALAAEFAATGFDLILAARDVQNAKKDAKDFELRYGISASALQLDITDLPTLRNFSQALEPLPDHVVCAIGAMGDVEHDAGDEPATRNVVETNFLGPALLLEQLAHLMSQGGKGRSILAISSVAGDRGRAKNYIYGASKAGLTTYLSGLRQKYKNTLHIMTIKPGFVRTSMTEGLDLPKFLTSDAKPFAKRIMKAHGKKREVYYDFRWWVLMRIIRAIPESIFKHMKF